MFLRPAPQRRPLLFPPQRAVQPQHIQRRIGDPPHRFRTEHLAHRGLFGGHQPLRLHIGHIVGHQPRHFALDVAVGQQLPHPGQADDGLAVADGFGGVFAHIVQQPPGVGRIVDAGTLEVQQRHCHIPAPVFLAHHIGARHPHIVEQHLVEFVAAGHIDDGAHGYAGRFHIHQHEADAPVLGGVGVGAGQQHYPVGAVGQRRPDFAAVDYQVVAVAHGAGAQRGQIGAGLRFAVALAPLHFASRHRRQMGAFLLFRPVNHQRRPQHPHAEDVAAGGAAVGHFFVEDGRLHRRGLLAAVSLRPVHRQPALVGHLPADDAGQIPVVFLRVAAAALPGAGQLGLDELLQLAAKGLVFRGKLELHCPTPQPAGAFTRPRPRR